MSLIMVLFCTCPPPLYRTLHRFISLVICHWRVIDPHHHRLVLRVCPEQQQEESPHGIQRLSDKTPLHFICCNKHFLDFIHLSLLIELKESDCRLSTQVLLCGTRWQNWKILACQCTNIKMELYNIKAKQNSENLLWHGLLSSWYTEMAYL